MRFQLDITLTEEDYLSFNTFHSFESLNGKKQIRKSRTKYVCIMLLLIVLLVVFVGWTFLSTVYVILLGLWTLLYLLLYKKLLNWNMKAQMKRLKKMGKLPFDPISKFEFYEDNLVETTSSTRTEQGYNVIERICVVKDRYILLYTSSIGSYILPVSQIKEQIDQQEFLSFLSQKCGTVEYY